MKRRDKYPDKRSIPVIQQIFRPLVEAYLKGQGLTKAEWLSRAGFKTRKGSFYKHSKIALACGYVEMADYSGLFEIQPRPELREKPPAYGNREKWAEAQFRKGKLFKTEEIKKDLKNIVKMTRRKKDRILKMTPKGLKWYYRFDREWMRNRNTSKSLVEALKVLSNG